MKAVIGSDHAGFDLKNEMGEVLRKAGHEVLDVGPYVQNPTDDYPDFAEALGLAVRAGKGERGVLICGSGVGAAVAANKLPGIRACVCHDTYSAHQGVEHDQMNVLAMGSLVVGKQLACELVRAYLAANFTGEERHVRRIAKIRALEEKYLAQKSPAKGAGQ